jgi:hypothetical protein
VKDCEVLVDGEWIPGTLLSWRNDPDGWKAGVRYTLMAAPSSLNGAVTSTVDTPMPFTWERTFPADQVRAVPDA